MHLTITIIGSFLMLLGFVCFVIKANSVEYIDAEGILHENFYLIPVGYLLVFTGALATLLSGLALHRFRKNTNKMTKHQRFANSDQFFACPHCGQALGLDLNSLRCPNRHTFDIAKQGYVNLAPQVKQSANYHKSSFENRQAF